MHNDAKQSDSDENLTGKRAHAAVLLAAGSSITDAAASVGVHRNTLATWIADPAFAKLVESESGRFLRETRTSVRRLRDKALSTLEAVLDGDNDAARARVGIAILQSLGGLAEPEAVIDKDGNKIVKIQFVNPGRIGVSGADNGS